MKCIINSMSWVMVTGPYIQGSWGGMGLWKSWTSAFGCAFADLTRRAMISMIWWWYGTCALYPSNHHPHCCWLSWASRTVDLRNKSTQCDSRCIPSANIWVDSLCYWSLSKLVPKCHGSAFSIIFKWWWSWHREWHISFLCALCFWLTQNKPRCSISL